VGVTSSEPYTTGPKVAVVICAYSEKRWSLLLDSVNSLQKQSYSPTEIIVSIDRRSPLLARYRQYLDESFEGEIPVQLVVNPYDGEIGSARNAGASIATSEIVAFLDDDAAADEQWLERLLAPYADPGVAMVGGRAQPAFQSRRPSWIPHEFDWTFGCAYEGLPKMRSPVGHLIGANLSVRRAELVAVGGFHWNTHDDMDLCHRVTYLRGRDSVIYEPGAVVHHFVPVERTTWNYFWRRCYFENKDKVAAMKQMGEAASFRAETAFVRNALLRGIPRCLAEASGGDVSALARAAAIVAGISFAAAGNIAGRLALLLGIRNLAEARGWSS
jgi:glucosyl-dolichyl phosphate glucuronosyltransferase